MSDEINFWRSLAYHDPRTVLLRLRALEHELANVQMEQRVRHLRTSALKIYREGRDAALFLYGLGLQKDTQFRYALVERSDYDFVAAWQEGSESRFCPVQLKELVPADRNENASLPALLSNICGSSRPSSTVLAVRLNRREYFELDKAQLPPIPFRELWFFWCRSPDAARWGLFGDALSNPAYYAFDYPTS
jgi:hypothetical protein